MNLLIVDDEVLAIQGLVDDMDWKKLDFDEVFTANSYAQAVNIMNKQEIDVLLCDIEMPLRSGVELVRWAKERKPELECIFLTCHAEFSFAKQAIQMGCMDYILKPVTYTAFTETLKKAVGRLQRKQENYISVSYRDGMVKLRSSDITFVESQGHRLTFHTETDSYETTVYTMKDVEERLRPSGFLRASSGTLVNLNRVTGTKNGFVRVGEQYLPISRGRKNEFMAALVSNMVE